ncbi:MAG: DivIVA domain-containing protein [Ruminococcaceae bacterium]|nr:DivIVA domain-containing protein [Oscillospiraceae bacterium]
MITPQQIEEISFNRATFGGYDMQSVDAVLEPLTEDYVALYKENALLKSKMRVLVAKLEEYRKTEASMQEAIANAQKTYDRMVQEAEEKCAKMIAEASAAAAQSSKDADALVNAENERVEAARRLAVTRIDELSDQLNSCLQALARIKAANLPVQPKPVVFDYDKQPDKDTDSVADEISSSLEALVGSAEETAPKAEPQHPTTDTTTKFSNLQFGPNYDPTHR